MSTKASSKRTTEQISEPEDKLEFLERLKSEWLAMIDAIEDPMAIISKDHHIKRCNKSFLKQSDLSPKDVVEQKCYKVLAGRSSPCDLCAIGTSRKNKSTFKIEEDSKYYEVSSHKFKNNHSDESLFVHVYHDRTEQVENESKLLRTEKLASLGLLAGGVAHELNNPLGGILIFSQMVLREIDEKNQHFEDIKEIESAARRCKDIVGQLLEFANERPKKLPNEKVELRELLEDAFKFAGMQFRSKDIKLKNSAPKNIKILANKTRLVQVILNIFQNSMYEFDEKGIIEIKTRTSGSYFEIAIQDNGPGINAKTLKKIFDPFFTTKDIGLGTGLGLSICHNIISELGGELTAKSSPGNGATFYIKLPTSKVKHDEA